MAKKTGRTGRGGNKEGTPGKVISPYRYPPISGDKPTPPATKRGTKTAKKT